MSFISLADRTKLILIIFVDLKFLIPRMKLINPLLILRILSRILLVETIAYLFCLPVIIIYRESALPFIISAVITLTLSGLFFLAGRKEDTKKFSNRDGYLAVVLSWIVFSLAGNFALPAEQYHSGIHRRIF